MNDDETACRIKRTIEIAAYGNPKVEGIAYSLDEARYLVKLSWELPNGTEAKYFYVSISYGYDQYFNHKMDALLQEIESFIKSKMLVVV